MVDAVPGQDTEPDTEPAAAGSVDVSGQRAVGAGYNAGIVMTGDRAQARQVTGVVTLGAPAAVDAPAGGLVGLPKPAVRTFVGRDAELAELDRLVRAGAGVVAQAVHGLGGVGKSELALQYAVAHRGRYRVVWWVLADNPDSIEAGLAELAFRLHPDVQVLATQTEAAGWAQAWLQSHHEWLLVLDNVEHRRHVEALLGQLGNGHVLVTTRRDVGWQDITNGCLRLDVLAPAEAVALLTRLSGQDDPGTAGALAGELGCLPLALQQAGAYLRQTRTPMTAYLHRLRTDPAQVLDTTAAGNDDAQRAVARTWSVTIDAITTDNPRAVRLLHLLACYAPDDLPRDILTDTVPSPGSGAAPGDVDAALGVLASYNMITLTGTTVSTHRLVQAVTVNRLQHPVPDLDTTAPTGHPDLATPQPWADILRTAVDLLRRGVPPGDPQTEVTGWPRWAVLAPHVAALAEQCPDPIGRVELAWLLDQTATYESTQGRYRQGLTHARRARAITEAALGPDHPAVAASLDNLAGSLRNLGRAAEAEPLHRRALAITEAAFGPDHPTVAVRLDNLAGSLRDLGRAADAEPLRRRALAISETALGPDHPDTALRLDNLAGSLRDLGRAADAEPLRRRALAITEAALGPDHPTVAIRLNNLAGSLRDLGRAADAEPLQRRALAITEAALGPDHPTVAIRLNNLAGSLRDLGRAADAEPLQRRALAITEAALGPDHPTVAIRLNNLALSLQYLGRAGDAEPLQRRALAITEAALGPDHPAVAIRLDNLALSLRDLGRAADAEPLHRRAAAIRTRQPR